MQALPGIRLIQENDKALASKIHSVLANTVRLLSIPAIVFAPRGSASGFLADVLSPVTLAVLLGTWLVALLLKDRRRGGAQRVTPRVVAPARVGRLPHLTPER